MKSTSKNIIAVLLSACLGLSVASTASAEQLPGQYLHAKRYDLAGRVTGTISPDPDGGGTLRYAATRIEYNPSSGVVEKVESGELSSWESEDVAPEDWSTFGVVATKEYTYDQFGRQLTETTVGSDGVAVSLTQFYYDARSRVRCKAVRMDPGAYDALPATACVLGAEGEHGQDRITQYSYDSRDQVLIEWRAHGTNLVQKYVVNTYDGRRLTSQTDANGNFTKLEYDGYKRLKKRIYPSKTSAGQLNTADYNEYRYDANGNMNWERKRSGKTFTYHYDANNRMTRKDGPGTSLDVVYDYDLRGLTHYSRFGSASGQGVTNFFDGFGNLDKSVNTMGGISRTITYQNDKHGNRTRITHPDGVYFEYYFDGLDRPKQIRERSSTLLWVDYENNGQRDAIARNYGRNGAKTSYDYDPAGRLNQFTQDLYGTTYDLTNTFSYNPARQLKEITISNDRFYYKGNENKTGAYSPNGLNQYTNINGQAISYDANGNLASDGKLTYIYDDENHLISTSGAVNSSFIYDPLGRLFETNIAGVRTQFLYDGDALIAEYNGSTGAMTRRYVHGDRVDEPWVMYYGSTVGTSYRRFLHSDHQGSVIAHSNTTGSRLADLAYDSFGIPDAGNIDRFGYTGQIWLKELGLYHYKARMYSPTLGRFLQTDPIFYEDQMNMYAYVGNDPVNMVDPTGEAGAAAGVAGIGAFMCSRSPGCVRAVGAAASAVAGAVAGYFNESSDSPDSVRGSNVRPTSDPVDLDEDLAGQEILGEWENGGGTDISDKMSDSRYDPDSGTHDKLRDSKTHADGTVTEVHGDRNRETGELSDTKFKDPPDNNRSRSSRYPR